MAAPYQAVILAAGRGSRLAELTREIPKALLPIGPRSLVDSTETSFLLLPEATLSRILTCYLEPDHPRYDFGEMHDRLYRSGFTIYPGKGARQATFRLANMGDVGVDDMRAFVSALKDTIEEMGLDPLYRS